MFVQGPRQQQPSPVSRKSLKGLKALELLVVADPHPTTWASLAVMPAARTTVSSAGCHAVRMEGSRVATNRSLQWGEQIVKPIFEAKNDHDVMYLLAKKCGFADKMFKNIKVENGAVRRRTSCARSTVAVGRRVCGQSPERLKAHMKNQAKFDLVTLRAPKDDPEVGGDYYGLPWPCWGTPEFRHPGNGVLYNTNLPVKEGGGTFRARFGVERVVKRKAAERAGIEKKTVCSPRVPIRSARKSRMVIRSSLSASSRSLAGTRTSPLRRCRSSTGERRQSRCRFLVARSFRRYPARGDEQAVAPMATARRV